jgi:TFIIH basal transcription factor complex TTD-A subunit
MVNLVKGVLITCDPAMRQLLLHLDETGDLGRKFVVRELDETHIFVDKEIIPSLEQRIDVLMDSTPDQH